MADKKYAGENGLSAIFAQIKAAIAGKADAGLINSISEDVGELQNDVTELQNGLTIKTKTLTPSVIAAGGYQSFEDADLKNVAVVGYWIGGVAGFNVTVISIISDGSGLHLVVKNNGETSVTPSSISVKYLG